VKPDALTDDLNPELQKSLEAQAAIIETDRLLELIDQFAAAEGRMKWAPNKRLHFEVAVIKAIQTLSQVTLNEVIENLAALRAGKSPPQALPEERISAKSNARSLGKTDVVEAARVAEQPPVRESNPLPEPPASPPAPESKAVDHETIWQQAIEQIHVRRPLIRGWVASAKALGIDGRFFVLGFPPEQKMAMESVASPRSRDFLEELLKEISGQDWKIKFTLKEGLPVVNVAEPATTLDELPARKKGDSQTLFKDDPLIREALEIFKGEIKTVSD
jgi:DNA polymerase-3 subunit gamma/tau